MEQLLDRQDQIPSRQITPETTPSQARQEDQDQGYPGEHHRLELLPDQLLQPGRVHVLPHLEHRHLGHDHNAPFLRQPTQPIFFTPLEGYPVDMEKYKRRVTEIAAGLQGFSPSQEYERYCRANWVARSEQYTKQHSVYTKLKNVLKKQ